MSDSKTELELRLARAFALLSKAAKRKRIHSHKATQKGWHDVAHFLRAMSASENVQARRLFNSMTGRVDTTDTFLSTVFEQEVQDILDLYSDIIENSLAERPAVLHAIKQLRSAETLMRGFYSRDRKDLKVDKDEKYFVCQFCGYLSTGGPPEECPVCTAPRQAFEKIA